MAPENKPAPASYQGVMVSSTFTDLEQHRKALIKSIDGQDLKSVVMENDSAKPDVDLVNSSLKMVQDGSAYVGVISHKYGQIPDCPDRNPDGLSLTELEFNEAQRLDRPILLFVMGDNHDVKPGDVETAPKKIKKLKAFRENAKKMRPDSSVHRVYKEFNNLHEFEVAATQSVANLRRHLEQQAAPPATETPVPDSINPAPQEPDPIPTPPAFYAEPAYIGSHEFVGRKAQLETLDDWAAPADSHSVLLFEAIGGTGKSMLTWEWINKHAGEVRDDWAGRFWYSFYERGAEMADFCRHALAYMTGQPLQEFKKKKTPELSELLLHQLRDKPWLIVLDGLERVLVSYQRFDAAQLADEEAGTTDQIANRDPCAAIRPEDDELLRALAGAGPSKLLLTSRLIPKVLLNASSQPIPGVLRERLPGLRPADAEALFRACGVTGDSNAIQTYLQSHCDCHPLVTGVLAGLVNHYLPDRGNFDAWAADPAAGGKLNLADLDLVQKRNHILTAALNDLDEKSRQLLSTLALLSEAVDYPTLCALNPHLPPGPEKVEKPEPPEEGLRWAIMSDEEKEQSRKDYQAAVQRWEEYKQAMQDRLQSHEHVAKLQETVGNLEHRGLLQYDHPTKRHDLHPVVRGIAAGGLQPEEKERIGQPVVDHFSQQAHNPYDDAETLDDLRVGLHLVRTLQQMGRHQQAFDAFLGDLANALGFNLEAHAEILSLLRPFFPQGWATLPNNLSESQGGYLTNVAATALQSTGESQEAFAAYNSCLLSYLKQKDWTNLRIVLSNVSTIFSRENRLGRVERCTLLGLDSATVSDVKQDLFRSRLDRFHQLAKFGQWTGAEAMWQLLDPMGRNWTRNIYRPGEAEDHYARFQFYQGTLTEEDLDRAEQLATAGKNRHTIRNLLGLRGEWQFQNGQYKLAGESLHEAIRLAHEVGQIDTEAETLLALAKFHLDQLENPRQEAERLAKAKEPADRALAELWLAIGDREQAQKYALAAYRWAWADGEPYVHRYELDKSRELLEQLGTEIPELRLYAPDSDEKLPWEDEVRAAIEKLRAEKKAAKRAAKKAAKKAKRAQEDAGD